jgi:hypothetical protein
MPLSARSVAWRGARSLTDSRSQCGTQGTCTGRRVRRASVSRPSTGCRSDRRTFRTKGPAARWRAACGPPAPALSAANARSASAVSARFWHDPRATGLLAIRGDAPLHIQPYPAP